MFVWVSSSAFFSSDITQTFLFCLQRVAAARFLSRNFRLLSSGSSSTTLLRRPPVGCGGCTVCVGCICCAAGETCRARTPFAGAADGREVTQGDAEMGREISRTLPTPQQGLQRAQVAAPGATESSCWQILAMVKGEIFFFKLSCEPFFSLELVLKNIHLGAFSATTSFKPEMSSFLSGSFKRSRGL